MPRQKDNQQIQQALKNGKVILGAKIKKQQTKLQGKIDKLSKSFDSFKVGKTFKAFKKIRATKFIRRNSEIKMNPMIQK